MIHQVRVAPKDSQDPKGQNLLSEIKRTLGITSIQKILTAKVYRLEGISQADVNLFAQKVLFEPITQVMTQDAPIFPKEAKVVEVAYKPGVMNPESASLVKAARDLKLKLAAADSSREYAFFGQISKQELSTIIRRLLVNETIEHVIYKQPSTLMIKAKSPKVQKVAIRNLSDKELLDLSGDRLFLNLDEMKTIQNYFQKIGRDPTDCEIEVLAQTWSEHCVHKTFKAKLTVDGKPKEPLFERIKATANLNKKLIVSAFEDNSGVIDFYDGFAICGKVETHNSPSAIEPYGGAMTGSGGVFRDILGTGQGAKVIASTDIFCFAPPTLSPKLIPPGCLPPDYLLRKVVEGVRDYGNRVGIPTNNGSVHFDIDFRAKPTVAVGSYGLIPKRSAKKSWPKKGDLILTIGGKTGRDGIHGATFSSGEMTARTITVSGSAVQIGNAIEEKRIIDAILVFRQKSLIRTLTDCGAGGYSSAIGEMGQKIGARVYLEKVPLKYTGLAPWEIFLSESQERMVLSIAPKNLKEVLKISKLYNVEAAVIGKFDGASRLRVTYYNQLVCDLEMQFLHHGLPQRKMIGKSASRRIKEKLPKPPKDLLNLWQKVLDHGNVCSKEPIVRMYDHTVGGTNALSPFGGVNLDAPNDAAIISPVLGKPYGVVIAHGLNPALNRIDPYWGSIWAVVEAVSNFICAGGQIENAALIDNFIWPYPDEESLADLDLAVDAITLVAKILKVPFVSGKDSLSSTYRYPNGQILKIPPVVLISVFGKIADVKKTASADFKKEGSTIVLVGKGDFENLGGSAYFEITGGRGATPKVDLSNLNSVFAAISLGIKNQKIRAIHDISEGGLATAIFEMCLGGDCGAEIDLSSKALAKKDRADFVFFGETAGTFLVEVANEAVAKTLFAKVSHVVIGKTIKDPKISVFWGSKKLVQVSVDKLREAWQRPMKEIFH